MTRYKAVPPAFQQRGPGPLGQLGNMAMQKGLQYGIETALPGGGFAAEAAGQILPGMVPRFNMGGKAPLGGGQTKEGLMQARKLGALTQDEFLKAMAHGGYLNFGGKVAGVKHKRGQGDMMEESEVKFHGPLSNKEG